MIFKKNFNAVCFTCNGSTTFDSHGMIIYTSHSFRCSGVLIQVTQLSETFLSKLTSIGFVFRVSFDVPNQVSTA